MKKLIALLLVAAVGVWTFGPVLAGADSGTGTHVTTSLNRVDGGTTGNDPIIKAVWEMYKNGSSQCGGGTCGLGEDEKTTSGAQFAAPGVWDGKMEYTVCAIVTDPNGVADIDGVYADIFYPEDKAFHYQEGGTTSYNNKTIPADLDNDGNSDYGQHGCGEFIEENTLLPLSKDDGYNLFCDTIYNHNNNLPTFFTHGGVDYDYNEICGSTGELMKETAKVYCDDKTLKWEDPAGDYTVEIFAIDKSGNFSYDDIANIDFNTFEYLPMIGYEVDFSKVDYGNVALNTQKIVSGDLNWDGANASDGIPSVRNIGNERIYMNISQDDMGLGQTSGLWNVKYGARVGNNEAEWGSSYLPGASKRLQDILDLSEIEEMDFSILVTKFPSTEKTYTGGMDLWATEAPFRDCVQG